MNYARPYVLAVAGTVSALVVACGNAGSSSDAAGGRDTPGPTTPDLTAAPRTRSRSPTRALDQWLDFLGNRLGGKPRSGTCVLEPAETCTSSSTATVASASLTAVCNAYAGRSTTPAARESSSAGERISVGSRHRARQRRSMEARTAIDAIACRDRRQFVPSVDMRVSASRLLLRHA